MPEHDDFDAHHQHHDGEFHGDCPECVERETSNTPNLRIPRLSKAKRWGVEDKVVDGEEK